MPATNIVASPLAVRTRLHNTLATIDLPQEPPCPTPFFATG